ECSANADLEFPRVALIGLRQPGTLGPFLRPGKVLGRHELSGPTELGPVDSVPINGFPPEPNLATDRLERISRDQSPVAEFFDLAVEVVEVREFLPFRPLEIGLDRFGDHRHGEDLERVPPRSPAAVLSRASQATCSARTLDVSPARTDALQLLRVKRVFLTGRPIAARAGGGWHSAAAPGRARRDLPGEPGRPRSVGQSSLAARSLAGIDGTGAAPPAP